MHRYIVYFIGSGRKSISSTHIEAFDESEAILAAWWVSPLGTIQISAEKEKEK